MSDDDSDSCSRNGNVWYGAVRESGTMHKERLSQQRRKKLGLYERIRGVSKGRFDLDQDHEVKCPKPF